MAFAIWSSLFGSGVLLARNFKDITLKRRRRRWGNLFHKSQIMCSVWRSGGAGGLGCVLLQKRRKSCLRRLWSQKWHVRETWVKNESITACPCKQGWGRRMRRGFFPRRILRETVGELWKLRHQHWLGQGAKQRALRAPALCLHQAPKQGISQLWRKSLSQIQLNWPDFYRVKILFHILCPALHGSAAFSFAFHLREFRVSLIP